MIKSQFKACLIFLRYYCCISEELENIHNTKS